MLEVNIFLKHKSLGCDMMRDTVRNIESCSDWYGSWLMEIYVIYMTMIMLQSVLNKNFYWVCMENYSVWTEKKNLISKIDIKDLRGLNPRNTGNVLNSM